MSTLHGFPCSWRRKTWGPFPKMPTEAAVAAAAGNSPAPTPRKARTRPVEGRLGSTQGYEKCIKRTLASSRGTKEVRTAQETENNHF